MAIKLQQGSKDKVLEVTLTGKIHREDYQKFVPEFEEHLQRQGKLRLLVDMKDFHGWDAGALWEDIKFDQRHFSDIERIALVGDTMWERGMALICKPFTTAEVRYFDHQELTDARKWISDRGH